MSEPQSALLLRKQLAGESLSGHETGLAAPQDRRFVPWRNGFG